MKLVYRKSISLFHPFQLNNRYNHWIAENEPSRGELERQRTISSGFQKRPLISVIIPVYKINPDIVAETIGSVIQQTYDNWELCIAVGDPENTKIIEFLTSVSREDRRIKLKILEENLGISGNSNTALSLSTGDFIALLDHDDLIAPFALYEVARELNADNKTDFLYSDRDLITEDGKRRFNPFFKPDWSPDIMVSANYLTHLSVIRKSLVENVGGFNPEMDGAQDWDLFLRVIELTNNITHIPKVLYHWRSSLTSCAERGAQAKPYIFSAQCRSISDHFQRQGQDVCVTHDEYGLIHVKWMNHHAMKVSIIIPSRITHLVKKCISSILERTGYQNYEIIIIDTGLNRNTDKKFFSSLNSSERIQCIEFREPFNYSKVNNLGATHSNGELLLFLNDDVEIINSNWLEELVGWIEHIGIGVVGAKLLNSNGTIQHAGIILGLGGFAGHPFAGILPRHMGIFGSTEWYRNFLAVTGACLMTKKEIFHKVGGFDERFILCGSDVEYCLRVRNAGYRIVYNPFACLIHHEATTRGSEIPKSDFTTSFEHYKMYLEKGDPFFNTNLSIWSTIPKIKIKGEETPLEFVQELIAVE